MKTLRCLEAVQRPLLLLRKFGLMLGVLLLGITISIGSVAQDTIAKKSVAKESIVVKGLFKNMIVFDVDGVQRTLRAGKTSPEGIHLISANTKEAIVEIKGERKTLRLSRRIGGGAFNKPQKSTMRISSGAGGHYFTAGKINGRSVNFLVDTGATSIAMNSIVADRIGLDYLSGETVSVTTASGRVTGYVVALRRVSVGTIEVKNIKAVVTVGAFPSEILLGNSFLSKVDFRVENGVLILQSRL